METKEEINLFQLSKKELLEKCAELGITKCSSKNKNQLIYLINNKYNKLKEKKIKFIIENEEKEDIITETLESNISISNFSQTNKYTLVDLFCGTGAFSYSFHLTNKVETIFANDILDSSEEIFNLNNLNNNIKLTKKNLFDIKDEDIPKSYILTSGFPCQPFSIAGMQKGFDDERSNVFWKILSIIKINEPEIVILENVKNLQRHDNGKTFTPLKI